MSPIGGLHPVLVHFPIALILAAAAAELAAIVTRRGLWRDLAVVNLRSGAAMAVLTVIAGWRLASTPFVEPGPALNWHGGIGLAAAVTALVAAVFSRRTEDQIARATVYRAALFASAALVALADHLGGRLVWGAAFTR